MSKKFAFIKHWSLKRKLFLATSLLILCSILLVTSLSFNRYTEDFSEQSTKQIQQLIEQLTINIDTYMDELFRLCISPYYSEDVMNALQHIPVDDKERLEKRRVIEGFLREVMTIPRNDILRVYILTDDIYYSTKTDHNVHFSESFRDEPWYTEAAASNETVFIPVRTEKYGGYSLSIFSVAKQLRRLDDTDSVLGVIRIDANYAGIEYVCDKVSVMENGALFIVDESNNIIYRNSKLPASIKEQDIFSSARNGEGTSSIEFQGEKYIINSKRASSADWLIISVNSYSELTKNITFTRNYTVLLAIICSAIGIVVAVLFVRSFLYPLSKTVEAMHAVQGSDLSVRASAEGSDEIAYLNSSFNEMLSHIQTMMERDKELTREIYEAQYLQKEAQYDALYNQIQPHFLFNTLNTISLLIKCKRPEEAIDSIDGLSTMLRGMINTGKNITLASEMKIIESYLKLQNRRYEALSYSIDFSPEYKEYMLPALTVQPIVENAFKHGFELKCESMHINVSTHLSEQYFMICVEDNGIGMDKEQLKALRASLDGIAGSASSSSRSVGLVNISRRIKLKFGVVYGLDITSELGVGTTVTILLPLERSNNVQGANCR